MAAQVYLDPLSQGLVDAMVGATPMDQLTIPQFRDLLRQFQTHEQLPGVSRTSFEVPVWGGTETWMYAPEGATGPLPYIFYIHGGGFVAGDIDVYDSIVSDLVLKTGFALVFPEYKLAPEVQWPEEQEQLYAVLDWFVKNGSTKNLVADKFAVVSDSAAGVLAFNVNVAAQKHNLTIPYNVFINPVTSTDFLSKPTPSRFEFWNGPYLTIATQRKFVDEYLPPSVDRASELASPINVSPETAAAFAPSLILTSAADILRDEAEFFGRRLQAAGRDVAVIRVDGQIHDSVVLEATRGGAGPKTVLALIVAMLKEKLG